MWANQRNLKVCGQNYQGFLNDYSICNILHSYKLSGVLSPKGQWRKWHHEAEGPKEF